MKKKIGLCIGAAIVFAAGTSVAVGDTIIGNFSADIGVGTLFGSGSITQFKAFGFTMGPDAYTLDAAVLTINFPAPGANPIVSIWSGANFPETELIVLQNPDDLLGQADYSFTTTSPFVLEAGVTYWVHMRPEEVGAGPSYTWAGTSPSTMPFGDHATAVGFNFNGNPSSFLNRLEVQGTPAVACPGDLTGDGNVGVPDLLQLLACWGPVVSGCEAADLTGNSNVGVPDLLELLANWGPCPN